MVDLENYRWIYNWCSTSPFISFI